MKPPEVAGVVSAPKKELTYWFVNRSRLGDNSISSSPEVPVRVLNVPLVATILFSVMSFSTALFPDIFPDNVKLFAVILFSVRFPFVSTIKLPLMIVLPKKLI